VNTVVTPLGLNEETLTGQYLRSVYLNESSPSVITGVNTTIADPTQITIVGDASAGSSVIMISAEAFMQGLYPPNPNYNVTLANGTTIVAPQGGQQFSEILSAQNSLEAWLNCAPFTAATTEFYQSAGFNQTQQEWAGFFETIPQFVDIRTGTNLENMFNIFDFMNVNFVHNATFAKLLTSQAPDLLPQARYLAAYHEYGVFSSPQLDGIGNIGMREMLPGILEGINSITNSSNPLKIYYNAVSYKPFYPLFRMTNAVDQSPELLGLANYASSAVIEVRQSSSGGEPVLRLLFKNGTEDEALTTHNWFNTTGDIPVSTFVNYLAPVAINTTADWCTVCSNTQDRGCDAIAAAASQAAVADRVHQPIGPVGAGFLGAGLTLFVALCMLAMLFLLGKLSFGKGRPRSHHSGNSDSGLVDQKTGA
jgi:hypothetical protein